MRNSQRYDFVRAYDRWSRESAAAVASLVALDFKQFALSVTDKPLHGTGTRIDRQEQHSD